MLTAQMQTSTGMSKCNLPSAPCYVANGQIPSCPPGLLVGKRHVAHAFAVKARKQYHCASNALDDYEDVISVAFLLTFSNGALHN